MKQKPQNAPKTLVCSQNSDLVNHPENLSRLPSTFYLQGKNNLKKKTNLRHANFVRVFKGIFGGSPKITLQNPDTIQTSWITFHHFIFRELSSVIVTPLITPNNSGDFISVIARKNDTSFSCPS